MNRPSQSNTIDFDLAKMQRLGFPSTSKNTRKPISLLELRRQLMLQLQSSLELERILDMLFHEIQRLIPLDAMTYLHTANQLRVDIGGRAMHSATYHLTHQREYLGEIMFRRNQRFEEHELGQLESLLATLFFPLRNALLYRTAVQNALRDALTGVGNRIALEQNLSREVSLAQRHGMPLSVLMLDIDHFKRINDIYGHPEGDEVLRVVSATLKNTLRTVDVIYRYGGEEFLILLSSTNRESAAVVGERLRQAIEALQYVVHGQPLSISVSLGCATLKAGESADLLVKHADQALYQAKQGGRNRVVMAGDEQH